MVGPDVELDARPGGVEARDGEAFAPVVGLDAVVYVAGVWSEPLAGV